MSTWFSVYDAVCSARKQYLMHHTHICMTSHLWNRIHLQAVWKCFLMSSHVSQHLFFLMHWSFLHVWIFAWSVKAVWKTEFTWQKSVFMRSTSHVGYVKSIQQSASAAAEYPHAFDSSLQSQGLHSQSTHYASHKKSQSYLITLDPTFPHLGDVFSDLSH